MKLLCGLRLSAQGRGRYQGVGGGGGGKCQGEGGGGGGREKSTPPLLLLVRHGDSRCFRRTPEQNQERATRNSHLSRVKGTVCKEKTAPSNPLAFRV